MMSAHSRILPTSIPNLKVQFIYLGGKISRQKSSLPPAKSSFRHHPIWCRANRHHSNVPRFVSRCSCLVFHEVGWSSIACSKRLLVTRVVGLSAPPPPSLPLNAFFLLLFRSIEKIFLWRCDSHFQGEMRRGDGATVLSSATIATNSHLQDTNWWVGPGWAVEDDGGAGSSMLKRRMRWKFKKRGGILSTRIGILNLNP